MTGSSFRAAGASDVGLLLDFMQGLYQEDGTSPLDRASAEAALRRLLGSPEQGLVFVIEREGKPAGYLVLTWGFSLEFHGRDAFIDELYVAPSHRGAGLGRDAVAFAEMVCRECGAGAVHLEVELGNERAHGLYRRSGFAERGLRLMSKRLDDTMEGG